MVPFAIVIGSQATKIERIAAAAWQEYWERLSGHTLPIVPEFSVSGQAGLVILGTPSTSRLVDSFLRAGHLAAAPLRGDHDGFALTRLEADGASLLSIAAATGKGVLSGTYHFFEQVMGVGFFGDGDRVPRLDHPEVPAVNLVEVPRFDLRSDMPTGRMGCQRFNAPTWDFEQWRRHLDWMAKKKMNIVEIGVELDLVVRQAFPEVVDRWEDRGLWQAEFSRTLFKQILEYGRDRGLRFLYVLWYGSMPGLVKAHYPDLTWHASYVCAAQPECNEFCRRLWGAILNEFGTDHLYTVRYKGEEGMEYSPSCSHLTKPVGYRQAYDLLKELDPDGRISAWSWAEQAEHLFPFLPPDFECQHMKHRLSGEWRFPGLGRDVPPGRPPIEPGRRWYNTIFYVFAGSETKLLTNLTDARYLIDDARLSAADPACVGYFIWPEWVNVHFYLRDLMTELAWAPDRVDLDTHIEAYARRRYGEVSAPGMADSLRSLLAIGKAKHTYVPSKRDVLLWHLSSDHIREIDLITKAVMIAYDEMDHQRSNPFYETDMIDLVAMCLYKLGWYFEARAYMEHLRAIQRHKAGDERAGQRYEQQLNEAGETAMTLWSLLEAVFLTREDYTMIGAAERMRAAGPTCPDFIDQFLFSIADFYYGYNLCSSSEEAHFYLTPQCAMLVDELRRAVERREPYTGGQHARWYWYDFDPRWKQYVYGMPFPDLEPYKQRFRAAIETGQPLIENRRDEGPLDAVARAIKTIAHLPALETVELNDLVD